MFEENIKLLEEKIANHKFIRNIKFHIKPDGTFDREGNLLLWDEACSDLSKIYLWEDGEKNHSAAENAAYMIFIPSEKPVLDAQPTILVAHGGGFNIRTGCEGANVAWEFHRRGYNVAILVYRMLPNTRYDSLADMQQAVRKLRIMRSSLGVGEKIVIMGFSAGAMLAGNCATMPALAYDKFGRACEEADVETEWREISTIPDLAVISYGAMSCVSFPRPFMSNADFSLFGDSEEDKYYFATEKHVTPKTPPMFIWQTLSDDGRHGMCLAKALSDAGVSYELHIMEGGVHGLALADGENDLAEKVDHINHWVMLCDEWIQMKLSQ